MKFLYGKEKQEAIEFMNKAAKTALNSTCRQAKCGSIIVKKGMLVGEGFNGPPKNLESQIRCNLTKQDFHDKVTDKTCCIHAEQRAIIDGLKNNPEEIEDSTLYFVRLDENGNIERAGKPYCTICSKMALDIGIAEFVLWHEKGICVYDTEEYNALSFNYK